MKTAEKILKKLDKIENELKNLNQGMLSLEERVSFLEKSYNQLRQDLDYRISSLEEKYDNIKYELDTYNGTIKIYKETKAAKEEFLIRRGHFRRKGNGFRTTEWEWVEELEW